MRQVKLSPLTIYRLKVFAALPMTAGAIAIAFLWHNDLRFAVAGLVGLLGLSFATPKFTGTREDLERVGKFSPGTVKIINIGIGTLMITGVLVGIGWIATHSR